MNIIAKIDPETVRQAQGRALAVVQLGDEFETISFEPGPFALQAALDALAERNLAADMASYGKKTTGVDNTIFISQKGFTSDARIKVAIIDSPDGKFCSVSVETGERVVGAYMWASLEKQVKRFVELNREVLFAYWYGQLTTEEMAERLQRIED
jgi:hypothetical protein